MRIITRIRMVRLNIRQAKYNRNKARLGLEFAKLRRDGALLLDGLPHAEMMEVTNAIRAKWEKGGAS